MCEFNWLQNGDFSLKHRTSLFEKKQQRTHTVIDFFKNWLFAQISLAVQKFQVAQILKGADVEERYASELTARN